MFLYTEEYFELKKVDGIDESTERHLDKEFVKMMEQ